MGFKRHILMPMAVFGAASTAHAIEKYSLSAFEGTWNCVDEVAASYKLTSVLSIKPMGGGLWKVNYRQEQNPQLDKPYESEGVWGYNAIQQKYFRYVADNFGGSDLGFTDSVDKNNFVWTGESTFFGEKFEYQGTFIFADSSSYQSVYKSRKLHSQDPWQETTRSECKKVEGTR